MRVSVPRVVGGYLSAWYHPFSSLLEQKAEISGGGKGRSGGRDVSKWELYCTGQRLRSRLGRWTESMGDGQWDKVDREREVGEGWATTNSETA